jgi:hypothetical protein
MSTGWLEVVGHREKKRYEIIMIIRTSTKQDNFLKNNSSNFFK